MAQVFESEDVAALAGMLRSADNDRLAIVARGSGTKSSWGPPLNRVDAVLSLARLVQPIEHCADDLTATLPAGATLGAVNETLARHGQWLPIDVDPATSIGGLIATGDSGPRRLNNGTPRDLILGVDMVLADGTIAKAGGRVVKNVSGYDLARMLCGSFGTLAVVTSATFKLVPKPTHSRTVVASFSHSSDLMAAASDIRTSATVPSAIDVSGPPWRLLVRVESTEHAAAGQAEVVQALCGSRVTAIETLVGSREAAEWSASHTPLSADRDALARVSILPASVPELLDEIDRLAAEGLAVGLNLRATLGVGTVRVQSTDAGLTSALERLRACAVKGRGSLVVLEAPDSVKARVPAWGDLGSAARVMRAVKQRFDPHGTLSPGREFA